MPTAPNVLAPVPQYQPVENPFSTIQRALLADEAVANQRADRAEKQRAVATARAQERSATMLAQATTVAVNIEYDKFTDQRDLAGQLVTANDGINQLSGMFNPNATEQQMASQVVQRSLVAQDPYLSSALQSFRERRTIPLTIKGAGAIKEGVSLPDGTPARGDLQIRLQDIPNHMNNPLVQQYLQDNSTPATLQRLAAQYPDKIYYNDKTGEVFGERGVKMREHQLGQYRAAGASTTVITREAIDLADRMASRASRAMEDREGTMKRAEPLVGVNATRTFMSDDPATQLAATHALDVVEGYFNKDEDTPEASKERTRAFQRIVALGQDPQNGADFLSLIPKEADSLTAAVDLAEANLESLTKLKAAAPKTAASMRTLAQSDPDQWIKLGESATESGGSAVFQSGIDGLPAGKLKSWLQDDGMTPTMIPTILKNREQIRATGGADWVARLDGLGLSGPEELSKTTELAAAAAVRGGLNSALHPYFDDAIFGRGVTPDVAAAYATSFLRHDVSPNAVTQQDLRGLVAPGASSWDLGSVQRATKVLDEYSALVEGSSAEGAKNVSVAGVFETMMQRNDRATRVTAVQKTFSSSSVLNALTVSPDRTVIATEKVPGVGGSSTAEDVQALVDFAGGGGTEPNTSRKVFDIDSARTRVSNPDVQSALRGLVAQYDVPSIQEGMKPMLSDTMMFAVNEALVQLEKDKQTRDQKSAMVDGMRSLRAQLNRTTAAGDITLNAFGGSKTFGTREEAEDYVGRLERQYAPRNARDLYVGIAEEEAGQIKNLAPGSEQERKYISLSYREKMAEEVVLANIRRGIPIEEQYALDPTIHEFLRQTTVTIGRKQTYGPPGAERRVRVPVDVSLQQAASEDYHPLDWGLMSPEETARGKLKRQEATVKKLVDRFRKEKTDLLDNLGASIGTPSEATRRSYLQAAQDPSLTSEQRSDNLRLAFGIETSSPLVTAPAQ